ncbi:ATPase, T2SS/T4P/T4SS family, partial [Salmonella enterica subsp. enterica serovar Anatum]|nr:ATPase, T2SS/T4P/T4SS family [Salmonella enterica subsp. enterica serovar Anatum]
EYKGDPKAVKIEESEINYLLKVYNAHFQKQLGRDDIVWTYSGIIVANGPTGHGKSTLLQCLAEMTLRDDPGIHLITVEDPVES